MKWILIIIATVTGHDGYNSGVAVDHMVFDTRKECDEIKYGVENPVTRGGIDEPIVKARCLPTVEKVASGH